MSYTMAHEFFDRTVRIYIYFGLCHISANLIIHIQVENKKNAIFLNSMNKQIVCYIVDTCKKQLVATYLKISIKHSNKKHYNTNIRQC